MKKKLIPLILVLVCAIACAFCLAACNSNKECLGIVAVSENATEKTGNINLGKYVYGEDDKINADLAKLKFFKELDDHSYEDIAVSELNVEYNNGSGAPVSKPEKYYCNGGNTCPYTFNYSLSGTTNIVQVHFEVEPATSGDFSVTLSKTQWEYGEKSATVTLKNFNGAVMQSNENGLNMSKDDTDYSGMVLYAMKKDYYDNLSAEDKKNYEKYNTNEDNEKSPNYGLNKYYGKNLLNYTANNEWTNLFPGEYVLITCVGSTNNYHYIVCATEFTVTAPDSPVGKTFVLTDLTISCDEGNTLSEGYIEAAASLKTANLGKTAVCANDGRVTGTCEFAYDKPFDDLTDNQALTLTFNDELLTVEIKNEEGMQLIGKYKNETLTLRLQQWTDGDTPIPYYFEFVFTVQTTN